MPVLVTASLTHDQYTPCTPLIRPECITSLPHVEAVNASAPWAKERDVMETGQVTGAYAKLITVGAARYRPPRR